MTMYTDTFISNEKSLIGNTWLVSDDTVHKSTNKRHKTDEESTNFAVHKFLHQ